jgi:vacuolar-type H+-ATPase subunit H
MENDILSKVIEVEREIQEKLREERIKSLEWLEKGKRQAEEEIAREEERLGDSYRKVLDDTVAEAEKHAAEIVQESTLKAEGLSRVSAEALADILLKYIPRILPEDLSEKSREPS